MGPAAGSVAGATLARVHFDDKQAELADIQRELDELTPHRAHTRPSNLRRYALLLAREELLLIELRRLRHPRTVLGP